MSCGTHSDANPKDVCSTKTIMTQEKAGEDESDVYPDSLVCVDPEDVKTLKKLKSIPGFPMNGLLPSAYLTILSA